jgi:hypothetical protein
MELLLNDTKTKELLTEIMIELMQSKREFFHEIVLEALEEVSLANAIVEGRKNDFVEENKIFALLDGN